ncbi:MAG: class I adenylate-forming enzyme family protein [Desulfosporosinus sp.]|jgi:long-chain acyl-CoA synthetase
MTENSFTYDVSMFKDTFEHQYTYINGFLRNTRRYAGRKAMICPIRKKSWTYAELDLEVNKVANALLQDGVTKNDVVMFQLFNCSEFVLMYLAPKKIGAIACPVNYRLSFGETAFIIDDSKPKVFVYDSEMSETVQKALAMAKHKPEKVVMVDYSSSNPLPGAVRFEDYMGAMADTVPTVSYQAHIYDEVTRLYTSGTTGMPKGVPLNNINDVLSAHDVGMHFPLSPRDITMNMTPWFHRGGLYSGGPNPTLYMGGAVIPLRNFDAKTVLSYVQEYGITFLIGVPAVLKMLHDLQVAAPRELQTLKGIVTMGAPLEREACITYQKVLTPNIFNGYGTTESFWNTFLRPFDLPDKAGSCGKSCTDDDARVVKVYPDRLGEPDEFVARDSEEVGEIIFQCPAKCSYAYINLPTDRYYKGWMYSGDLGTWDKDEYITVVSRKDDMLISGGENVYPVQVEEALNEHSKVRDSMVVGLKHKKWGQVICAYVVKEDPSLTVEELNEHCKGHPMLSRFKRPKYYRFVDELLLNATGKKVHYKQTEIAEEEFKNGLLEEVK